ncbi:MAG TPA: ComEC/Rec2 family competence protein [Flavisolibacter sp.]|jgi:competence protein ComEC|nr:ComEC/Rec2 family competence protein [Flavisolibacter sp.]
MAARIWHKAPFVRLLLALAAGILLQWYVAVPLKTILLLFTCSALLVVGFGFTTVGLRYRLRALQGFALTLLVASCGSVVVWLNDVRNHSHWAGHHYQKGDFVAVTLQEPLVEKANSYKALATVDAVYHNRASKKATGEIILYFRKDSFPPGAGYGSRLLVSAPLQAIRNAGNPGSFDYKTYSLFQGITHQVYLTPQDYVVQPGIDQNSIKTFIFRSRSWVVATLKKYIPGEKEQGLAEALLIGYKDDLDKNLVQAYSNTGVVHIIAISGLHLGIIYAILLLLTKPMKRYRHLWLPRLLLVLGSLWGFSILAGAGPSVLRSALMFSLIAIGESTSKKTNIFNTLSFSAFVLLCINPFWLWDVGFQLSYAAVLSIVLFFRPVYNWFHFSNKLIDFTWKLTAVTIAAQILTLPISIYHFHQMPLLFLVTNFIAVPLSSLILMGEILLCALYFLSPAAILLGKLLRELIVFMNSYIEGLDRLPFATWNLLSISILQTVLLLIFALSFSYWLMEKQRLQARAAFASLALFMLLRGISFYEAYAQKKLVVYNVPKHPAIDIINGRNYAFLGDSLLLYDGFERNFHLQPSRILHRVSPVATDVSSKSFSIGGKQILLLDDALPFAQASPKQQIDVLILSKNPKLYISRLLHSFQLKQVVIDGSVPPWKAALWKKDCDSLQIPVYDVSEKGAFVTNW